MKRTEASGSRKRPRLFSRREALTLSWSAPLAAGVGGSVVKIGFDIADGVERWEARQLVRDHLPRAKELAGFLRDHQNSPSFVIRNDSPHGYPDFVFMHGRARAHGYSLADPTLLADRLHQCRSAEEGFTALNEYADTYFHLTLTEDDSLMSGLEWRDVISAYQALVTMSLLPRELYDAVDAAMPPDADRRAILTRDLKRYDDHENALGVTDSETQRIAATLQQPGGPPLPVIYNQDLCWILLHEFSHRFGNVLHPLLDRGLGLLNRRANESVPYDDFSPGRFPDRLDFARAYGQVEHEDESTMWERLIGLDVEKFQDFKLQEINNTSPRVMKLCLVAAAVSDVVNDRDRHPQRDLLGYLRSLHIGITRDAERDPMSTMYARRFVDQFMGWNQVARTLTSFANGARVFSRLSQPGALRPERNVVRLQFGVGELRPEFAESHCSDNRVKIRPIGDYGYEFDTSALPPRSRFTFSTRWHDEKSDQHRRTNHEIRLGAGRDVELRDLTTRGISFD